jgi:crossover junction endodeoxyribonuclease RuvC
MRSYREYSGMVVLGIDPGIANTGYGVVAGRGGRLLALDGGVIETAASEPLERRLVLIADRIRELIGDHAPDAMAVESLYFGRNAVSAFQVGQARGAVVCEAGRSGVPVTSYTPQQIKLAVCGTGSAGKDQVKRMTAALLDLPGGIESDHAADALAVGVCHVNAAPLAQAIGAAS